MSLGAWDDNSSGVEVIMNGNTQGTHSLSIGITSRDYMTSIADRNTSILSGIGIDESSWFMSASTTDIFANGVSGLMNIIDSFVRGSNIGAMGLIIKYSANRGKLI